MRTVKSSRKLAYRAEHGVAVQADGQIVVGGQAYIDSTTGDDFAVVRYNADGSLDTSFGTAGQVITDFDQTRDYGHDVAIDGTGRIMVAGYVEFSYVSSAGPANDFAVARYDSDGSLDTSFDGDGKVTSDFFRSQEDDGLDVVTQPDGKLVVVGRTTRPGSYYDYTLTRYNPDGSLDAGASVPTAK